MPCRLSRSSRHWQRHWSMLRAFVIDKIKLRTHVFLCQCRLYYFQHTTMEYRMIYHGWKINIFQSINVLLISYQCQKALESWQVFALSSKNIFFLVVSIETLTFKNALLRIEKKSWGLCIEKALEILCSNISSLRNFFLHVFLSEVFFFHLHSLSENPSVFLCKLKTFMTSICEKTFLAEVRLIHAEQMSLYNFIVLRKNNRLSWRLNSWSKTF